MPNLRYTCNDYRREMILVGLKKQLTRGDLSEGEKGKLELEIRKIEAEMELE